MKKFNTAIFLVLMFAFVGCSQVFGCATVRRILEKSYETSAVAFYEQSDNGGYNRVGTAIAFENASEERTYRFIVPGYLVAQDDELNELARLKSKKFFINLDGTGFFEVRVVAAGYQKRGDKFAVVEAQLGRKIVLDEDMAKDPAFKKFWSEFKDGKYKWFRPE